MLHEAKNPKLFTSVLPGKLKRGAVHEITGPAARAVTAAVLAQGAGPVVWCRPAHAFHTLYMAGLNGLGLSPKRLVTVACRNARETLWAMEEALKSGVVEYVAGEFYGAITLVESRRLALAASGHHATGFVLPVRGRSAAGYAPSAWTRWQAAFEPAGTFDVPRWRLNLIRSRAGQTGAWSVDWHGKTLSLLEVSASAARPSHARA